MRQLFKFNLIIVIVCLASCEPDPIIAPNVADLGPIRVNAVVQTKLYTNARDIALDASVTQNLNGNRTLYYSWICKEFPSGKLPIIHGPLNMIAYIDSIQAGKYSFQLTVHDDLGYQSTENYSMEVFQDTLIGSPKIVPLADTSIYIPESFFLLSAKKSIRANPYLRQLTFKWSVLEKPAGSPDPGLEDKASETYLDELVVGNYQVMLKITNELGLFAYDTISITVLPDKLTGTTKEYETNWIYEDDGMGGSAHVYLKISDEGSFLYRDNTNTTIMVFNTGSMEWMSVESFIWKSTSQGFTITAFDLKLSGQKAKVLVEY